MIASLPASPGQEEENIAAHRAPKPRIVIVDDNAGDVFLMEESLREHRLDCDVVVLSNGEDAIAMLDGIDQDRSVRCPDLILLDLNLPKQPGHKVLEQIRRSPRCHSVPVLIVTSSESETDLAENQRLGATAYFRKPSDLDSFMKLGGIARMLLAES